MCMCAVTLRTRAVSFWQQADTDARSIGGGAMRKVFRRFCHQRIGWAHMHCAPHATQQHAFMGFLVAFSL